MKRILIALAALAFTASLASAQDMAMATDTFTQAATILNDEEGDKAEALKLFKEALSMGELCGEEGEELVANCKKVIPGLVLAIAKGQINDADYDNAVATLKEAAAAAKDYEVEGIAEEVEELIPNAYLRKGTTLMKAKDFEGAVEALKNVVAAKPEDGQTHLMIGQALMQLGNNDGAVESLLKAAEFGKADNANKLLSNIYLKQGMTLLKEGNNAGAIDALEKVNAIAENANAYKLLASAYTKSGKTANALDAYKNYLKLSPNAKDAAGVKLTIAATAQKAGDKATAIEYYKMLVGDAQYGATAKQQLEVLQK